MDTMKDTTMQHVTDAVIAEIKRAAEHPLQAPVIVRAAVMLGILARIEQLEPDLATAEQDSRQKQASRSREMTPNETTTILRQFNGWRRGDYAQEEQPTRPDPVEISEAIDAAVEMIERMRDVEVALREIAWSNDSKWQADRARSALE